MISLNFDVKELELIDAKIKSMGMSRTEYLRMAAMEYLKKDGVKGLKKELERRTMLGRIDQQLDEYVIDWLKDGNVLDSLDMKTKANLILSRAPKPQSIDTEADKDLLSLENLLLTLPSVDDLHYAFKLLRNKFINYRLMFKEVVILLNNLKKNAKTYEHYKELRDLYKNNIGRLFRRALVYNKISDVKEGVDLYISVWDKVYKDFGDIPDAEVGGGITLASTEELLENMDIDGLFSDDDEEANETFLQLVERKPKGDK